MPRAASLAEHIVNQFKPPIGKPHPVESIELIPGGKGIFEVKADGELIFSKHQAGRHAEPKEVLSALSAKL